MPEILRLQSESDPDVTDDTPISTFSFANCIADDEVR